MGVYAVANWDEAGTKHGAFFTFANLRGQARLLVGPAPHCAWTQVKTDTGFDIVAEELRFFDYWLKGIRNGVMEEPAVTYYTYNAPPTKPGGAPRGGLCRTKSARRSISAKGR